MSEVTVFQTNSDDSAIGHLTTPARQSGTHCQMNLKIPTVCLDSFKRFMKTILYSRY